MPSKNKKGGQTFVGTCIGLNITEARFDLNSYPFLSERVQGYTNIGAGRAKNQDAASAYFYHDKSSPQVILTVADGLGAFSNAEKAAYYVVNEVPRYLYAGEALEASCLKAHRELVMMSNRAPGGINEIGCTTLVLAVVDDNQLTIANVGDSRGYLIRNGKIIYQTRDQSMVELLLSKGELSDPLQMRRHSLRNVILNSLGSPEPAFQFEEGGKMVVKESGLPQIDRLQLQKGDLLFMATDGVFTNLTDSEIAMLITDTPWEKISDRISKTVEKILQSGVTTLNEEANHDNFTFVVYRHL